MAAAGAATVGAAFGVVDSAVRQTPELVPAKTLSLVAASDQTRLPSGNPVLNEVQVAPLSLERYAPLLSVPAKSRSFAASKQLILFRPEVSADQLVPLLLETNTPFRVTANSRVPMAAS